MTRTKVLSLVLLLFFVATALVAQEQTASIQGTVTDETGGALPGATVEAVRVGGGQRYSAISDSNGGYRFPSVPPGSYNITATLGGMEPATANGVEVRLGSSPKIDLKLGMTKVAETLTVTADAPLVDTTSSASATSIPTETFEKLPRGRDFATVVTQSASANQNGRAGGISIDGASGSENRYIMDGVDTTNPQTGTQGKTLVTDFVDEVQVKSAGYAAEFGGSTGGVINVVTKTGTNDFKGSVGAFYSERDWGGEVRPVLQTVLGSTTQFEQFTPLQDDETTVEPSVTLGGPIMKDRLWFYGGYEPWLVSTTRTVRFVSGASAGQTGNFDQDFRRNNYIASLSGNLGSKFLYKGTFNNSGYETENLLPSVTGRTGSLLTDFSPDDEFENWTASGYADFIASPEWFFSAKGGRFYRNYSQQGISSDVRINFASALLGSKFPEVPANLLGSAGFNSIPTNSATQEDAYTRDNINLDVSWFPQFAGTHRFKGGVQFDTIKNEVQSGQQNYLVEIAWDQVCRFCSTRGKYGSAGVYVFETSGNVEQENTGFFIQDSWTTMNDRLTLNLGVRTEQEKVPAYNSGTGIEITGDHAIQFDYGDKLAPRIGFSYDVFGNGRTKAFGSYGTFYDIIKTEMPRGSFGGDKWIFWTFDLDDYDWTKWYNCQNVTNNLSNPRPTCPGMTFKGGVDLRHASNTNANPLVDPDLKPMESREFSLGAQQELTNTMALGFRYVNKELIRAIEDVGVHVFNADGTESEEFFIANPGEGVATTILAATGCSTCPAMPKAKRDYQAWELEFTKRFNNNWLAHASYVYSKLEGNYSGLANSDESAATGNARTSPNVNRIFDSLFMLFDQTGVNQVEGPLGGDIPHQFKAQVAYQFNFGTTLGVNQYYYSGTPSTTEMRFQGAPWFAFNRNDLGRTPNITQTDVNVSHDFRFGRFNVQVGAIVLNLFDEDEVLNRNPVWSTTSILLRDLSGNCADKATNATCIIGGTVNNAARNLAQAQAFFRGVDAKAQRQRQVELGLVPSPTFNQPNAYQDPRSVRVFAKLTF